MHHPWRDDFLQPTDFNSHIQDVSWHHRCPKTTPHRVGHVSLRERKYLEFNSKFVLINCVTSVQHCASDEISQKKDHI